MLLQNKSETSLHFPFLDLAAGYLELKHELDAAYQRVMGLGMYIGGAEVEAFQREYAVYCGAKYCVGMGNGLDALTIILRALGIGDGDEVIVPTNTFIATWQAVTQVGATVVPVEPCEKTYNIDPEKIVAAITPKTKAIMPVHLYGQVAAMDEINSIANSYGLQVVEDAAQSQGAALNQQKAGTFGIASGFSFYPGKNLGAFGDAGAVTTNDEILAEKIAMFGNYGSKIKYKHEIMGFNSRLDPLQAAFLRVKIKYLDEWNARRQKIASTYNAELCDVDGLVLPYAENPRQHVWHMYVVRVKDRAGFRSHLEMLGVPTGIHYPTPPHLQGAYAHLGLKLGAFPISEQIHKQVVSLPIGPHMTEEMVEKVIMAVRSYYNL
ncbi:MAG: DegT/DnrJ/EryC1/StrS family aminotransferase [Alphaproteobacteria bacterium]|nr:DegT/DnrJ/EryC1/StrS family aminotransferase [Alphaproteobacteria bacterium]